MDNIKYVLKGAKYCFVLKDEAKAALNVVKGFLKVSVLAGVGYIAKEAINKASRGANEDLTDSAKQVCNAVVNKIREE